MIGRPLTARRRVVRDDEYLSFTFTCNFKSFRNTFLAKQQSLVLWEAKGSSHDGSETSYLHGPAVDDDAASSGVERREDLVLGSPLVAVLPHEVLVAKCRRLGRALPWRGFAHEGWKGSSVVPFWDGPSATA